MAKGIDLTGMRFEKLVAVNLVLLLAEWSERIGLHPKTLSARLGTLGWEVDRALTAPLTWVEGVSNAGIR